MRNRILIDYSNLAHRMVHGSNGKLEGLTESLWNSMLRFVDIVAPFAAHGEHIPTDVVVALDGRNCWRREVYPDYKADRIEKRASDGIDWVSAYAEFDRLSDAIARHTPWKVVRVDGCEADDVIAVLTRNRDEGSTVVINSSDSDYLQLVGEDVFLWSPHVGEFLEFPYNARIGGSRVLCGDASEYLQYAILTGQGGKDNVPNVRTPTGWVSHSGKRRPGFGVKAATNVLSDGRGLRAALEELGLWENYERNRTLIDLSRIPERLVGLISAEFVSSGMDGADYVAMATELGWYCQEGLDRRLLAIAGLMPREEGVGCSAKALAFSV